MRACAGSRRTAGPAFPATGDPGSRAIRALLCRWPVLLHGHKTPLTTSADLRRQGQADSSSYGRPLRHRCNQAIGSHQAPCAVDTASDREYSQPDFRVRYLVMSDAWIALGELALLQAYYPVLWNTYVTGFGSNASGTDRRNGRSVWDTLHGGRPRAKLLRAEQVLHS